MEEAVAAATVGGRKNPKTVGGEEKERRRRKEAKEVGRKDRSRLVRSSAETEKPGK